MKIVKIASISTLAIASLAACNSQGTKVSSSDLKTIEQKASYALGVTMAQQTKMQISGTAQQVEGIDSILVTAAFNEYMSSGKAQMDSATIASTLEEYQKIVMEKKTQGDAAGAQVNIAAGQKYIADQMAANPKLQKTASGLVYEVMSEGSGAKPSATSTVSANYKGMLIDGTVFDESKSGPIEFPLTGVIKGWTEGLQLMSKGAKYKFLIPADLAYGNQERPPHIKPGSTLVFEVELKEIK